MNQGNYLIWVSLALFLSSCQPWPVAGAEPQDVPLVIVAPEVTRVNPVDGMLEVFIPAVTFSMGGPVIEGRTFQNNLPQRQVSLDAYWIGLTPVTNAMYTRCIALGVCDEAIRAEHNPHFYDLAYADHPVVFVNHSDARRYCQWSGGNLPSEAQWENAARGPQPGGYPWGLNPPTAQLANIGGLNETTVPVGSYPAGASIYGVLDMGGNVREWVADWFKPNYKGAGALNPTGPEFGEKRVLRGAAWDDPANYAQYTHRLSHGASSPGINRGFRCAYAP
jgi:formylglycine-generating enzyme required for sulfatase activity